MLIAVLLSTAIAHYQLSSPTNRGYDDLAELTPPCAGFPLSSRSLFPLKAPVIIASYHNAAVLSTFISFSSNPTSNSDFISVGGNTTVSSLGTVSTAMIDFTQFNATVGRNATIQTIYNGPDGLLYQCNY